MYNIPENSKIYHIVHYNNLESIIENQKIFSYANVTNHKITNIGMQSIKDRRLKIPLKSHKDLYVGQCVPFYFCPRSVMLYMFSKQNHPELSYKGGQEPIIHLVSDLKKTLEYAKENKLRWAFTCSNAGSNYFEDYSNPVNFNKLDWNAINSNQWNQNRDKKQAEFLIENEFSWNLVEEIGVYSMNEFEIITKILVSCRNKPNLKIRKEWYY
ncbi:MAG: DUF4433 domain-containing protein [Candidatus Muirbacterium halophilum]|nr:DUF4433 domain-containing protein [Candidatus Muirbacterium halophilum]MCK9475064.1 DUF4433 domain-containing protein [Candidatus Muirbacterium halophilum]